MNILISLSKTENDINTNSRSKVIGFPIYTLFLRPLKFATDKRLTYLTYLARHREVTDVLLTGGDPLIMKADRLRAYVEPLLEPEFDHIQTIRIGTKSPASWPHRFVDDGDADDILRCSNGSCVPASTWL